MKGVMAPPAHLVGRLDVQAVVADLDSALALRPRLERLAWRTIPDAVEEVCDAMATQGLTLRLERLDLDLGSVAPDRLEEDVLRVFRTALSEALAAAMHEARRASGGPARLITDADLRLERFETYLMSGNLPFQSVADQIHPLERLRQLAAEHPDALVAMLRRRAGHPHVLERLAVQTGEAGLRALLKLLAPADAALILGLIADVMLAQREAEPPLPVAPPELERLLHVATLEFLLRDAGTQFNRRRFLNRLLERQAALAGIELSDLLELLGGSVERMRARSQFRSSLPIILSELLAEPRPARLEEKSSQPSPGVGEALAGVRGGDFEEMLALMRHRSRDLPGLQLLVARLDWKLFAGLVGRLEPADADTVVALVEQLVLLYRDHLALAAPALLDSAGENRLRALTLAFLLRNEGAQFSRSRFVEDLLRQEAARTETAYPGLLRLLSEAAASGPKAPGAARGLAATLAELQAAAISHGGDQWDQPETAPPTAEAAAAARAERLHDLTILLGSRAGEAAGFEALARRVPDELLDALLERSAGVAARSVMANLHALSALHRAAPLLPLAPAGFDQLVRVLALRRIMVGRGVRFELVPWLRGLIEDMADRMRFPLAQLREGLAEALCAHGAPARELEAELAAEVAAADRRSAAGAPGPEKRSEEAGEIARALGDARRDTAAALRRAALNPILLHRVSPLVAEKERPRLLARLDPTNADAVGEEMQALARLHAASPILPLDRRRFGEALWALAVAHLAGLGAARFDRRAFVRGMIEGLALYGGTSAEKLASGVRRSARSQPRLSRAMADEIAAAPHDQPLSDRHRRIEHYLRTGQPPVAGEGLPAVAAGDPLWLAATIRRLLRTRPGGAAALIERLLDWLLPEELMECLAAADPGLDRRWGERLAGGTASQREADLALILEGGALELAAASPRVGPTMDRLAAIGHWLDHGARAWWDPPGPSVPSPGTGLDRLTLGELTALFQTGDPERTRARLWRAAEALPRAQAWQVLDRLAPWATTATGPLQRLAAARDDRRLLELAVHAAAAAMEGEAFALEELIDLPMQIAPPRPASVPDPETVAAAGDPARLLAWLGGAAARPEEAAALARHFARLADAGDPRLLAHLQANRSRRSARARWAAILPNEALGRIVHLLVPAGAFALLQAAQTVRAAWRQLALAGARQAGRVEQWASLLDLIAAPGPVDLVAAAHQLVHGLSQGNPRQEAQLRARAQRLAKQSGHVSVAAALRRLPTAAGAGRPAATAQAPGRPHPAAARKPQPEPPELPELPAAGRPVFVRNAGLVLVSPYLPTLFDRLGLIAPAHEKPRIEGFEAVSRAVHLLQYLVDGQIGHPEPDLALNKLLCGVPISWPVAPAIDPDRDHLDLCDGLLSAIIATWTIIGNASPDGLRETFLRREGRLLHSDGRWTLKVNRRSGLDVLVDQIPWGFSTIFHRWMPEPVQVTW
jgi:hypothetical protein